MDGLLGIGGPAPAAEREGALIVRVTEPASRDLSDTEEWLQARSPAAASRLTGTLRAALASLTELPNRGRPGAAPGTRELLAEPYIITYRVTHEVVVVRITHHAQLR